VDTVLIPDDLRLNGGAHPTEWLFEQFRTLNIQAVPVTGLTRDATFQTAIRNIAQSDKKGVCLRLEADDMERGPQLGSALLTLVSELGAIPQDVDLVVDFSDLGSSSAMPYAIASAAVINSLPAIKDWRTLTLAGSAFPVNLSQFTAHVPEITPRTEWRVWTQVVSNPDLVRLPAFGDYAVQHPEPSEINPKLMKMSAQLRYARQDDWLIFKGRNVRDYGHDQFTKICEGLAKMPDFRGAAFSWGDKYIADCAAGTDGPGNATTWRKVATSHHLAVVSAQLASLP
jgi:hypothetical protein